MTMATPLAEVAARVGEDAFLVPCEWGTKKPLVTYVERPFEGTKSPAYRAMFEAEPTNIAVYLGKASGGLCALDFDRDEDLAARNAAKSSSRSKSKAHSPPDTCPR